MRGRYGVIACLAGLFFSYLGSQVQSEELLLAMWRQEFPYYKEEESYADSEKEPTQEIAGPVTENEIFKGYPQDHYVTVLQDVIEEVKNIKDLYPQNVITDFAKTSSLYLYSSSVLKVEESFIDGEKFMEKDLSIDMDTEEPKILICHTHAHEGYVDKEKYGILDVGDYLAEILSEQYGISVIHHTVAYDEEGINGAYDRLAAGVSKVLAENPSIEVVIDMHRDGVAEDVHLVQEVDGKQAAQVMLVNGVSQQLNAWGELEEIPYLENPNREMNLALSFRLKMASEALYPEFMRPIYLARWRYSTYLKPLSILLEVGAQTNTVAEAKAAMEPFAKVLYTVLSGNG